MATCACPTAIVYVMFHSLPRYFLLRTPVHDIRWDNNIDMHGPKQQTNMRQLHVTITFDTPLKGGVSSDNLAENSQVTDRQQSKTYHMVLSLFTSR